MPTNVEYPMHPHFASSLFEEAFKKNCEDAGKASAEFFNDVSAAQQKLIEALVKILPEWKEGKELKF
jgi:hypothetical protein